MCKFLLLGFFAISAGLLARTAAREAVLGGKVAADNQFPYQVSVQVQDKGHVCGGAIIGAKFILTAAHCVRDNGGRLKRGITILAGTSDLHKTQNHAVTVEVVEVFVPHPYKFSEREEIPDIAVLELARSLNLSHGKLTKLDLGEEKKTYAGDDVEIAGFSWNTIDGQRVNFDNRLRYSEASVITNQRCKKYQREINKLNVCGALYMPPQNLRSVCTGDDGGPLVYNRTIVVGVLSKLPHTCSEEQSTGVYMRVSEFLHFIRSVMQKSGLKSDD